jgi:hypothetical protein
MDARATISCGWPFKKDIGWPALALIHAALKDILVTPELQELLLHLRVIDGWFYILKVVLMFCHFLLPCLMGTIAMPSYLPYNRINALPRLI